jgi:hypothetical protein
LVTCINLEVSRLMNFSWFGSQRFLSLVVGRRLVCLVRRGSLCCEVYVEFYDSAVSFFDCCKVL